MAQEARRALTRALAAFALSLALGAAFAAGPAKKNGGPSWAELTADQQQVLAPLKSDWESLSPARRTTWVGIAKRYPAMKPHVQQRVVRRMQTWAKLTPEQRVAARERYRSLGKLPPEKRHDLKQQWAEYQALPPAEKRMFDVPPSSGPGTKRKPRSAAKSQTAPPKVASPQP
ncbi:MAG: DUF3106 domain-containing protein [Betaproteobacteria bacterium]|nr:MAG: DUF3106 domain-containing protein [Betaproteobacteria bacterium]